MSNNVGDGGAQTTADSESSTPATFRRGRKALVAGRKGVLPWSRRRVLGLLAAPIGAVTVAAGTLWAVPSIENQLEDETRRDLEAAGIDTSELDIDFDFRNGDVTGRLPDGVSAAEVKGIAAYRGIRELDVADDDGGQPASTPSVTATLDADRITLTGTVDQATHDRLVEAAAARVGADNVDDQLTIDDTIDGTGTATTALVDLITGLDPTITGTATLADDQVDLTATAPDQASADAALANLPTDVTATIDATAPTEPEPGDGEAPESVARILRRAGNVFRFDTASAMLDAESDALLVRVATALNATPGTRIRIAGHTDDVGAAAANRQLSLARAQAVADRLVELGVDAESLEVVGRGERRPTATNATAEGRAQNRRVTLGIIG